MTKQTMVPMKVIAKRAGCSRSHVITFMKRLAIEHVGAMGNQYYYAVTDAESVIAKIREEKGKKKAPAHRARKQAAGDEVVVLLRRIADGIDALVARRQKPAKGNHVPVSSSIDDAEQRLLDFLADKQFIVAGDAYKHVHGPKFSGSRWTHMNACLEALGWDKRMEKRVGGGQHAVWYPGSGQ